jgi:hypothetical protein
MEIFLNGPIVNNFKFEKNMLMVKIKGGRHFLGLISKKMEYGPNSLQDLNILF